MSSPEGWYWHIPLAGDRWSVGLVTPKRRFAEHRARYATLDEYYLDIVRAPDGLRSLLRGARFEGKVRAEQEYSYVAERFCGPGYVIIGDAACFLDPLLSTGVHLAQYSATVGAAAIATWLRGDMTEPEVLAFFDYTYRRAYSRMLALVSRMYREYIGMDDYFGQSQHLVHADGHGERPVRSFTQIVTGLIDVREAAGTTGRVATEAIADAAGVKAGYMGGIDMSSVWNIWRDPLGPDTAMGDIRVRSHPWLGLYRSGSER